MAATIINKKLNNKAALDLKDMQGLIARGYGELKFACYLLLQITDKELAKNYFKGLVDRKLITPADKDEIHHSQKQGDKAGEALHIAFTPKGLAAIGLPKEITSAFSFPFRDGMTLENRSKILGDDVSQPPSGWQWGGTKNKDVHFMLLCYAFDKERLNNLVNDQTTNFTGIEIIKILDTFDLPDSKEHFGFHDGISQPPMEGLESPAGEKYKVKAPVKAGEFVLGYKNEYGQFSPSPYIPLKYDPKNLLEASPVSNEFKDLGKNGTYLVFRQITQDVVGFWQYLKAHSKEPAEDKSPDPAMEAAIKLGAKMVGRWPDGASLANHPEYHHRLKEPDIDIDYYKVDQFGERCPFGAHIRRTNPRNQIFSSRPDNTSAAMVRKHHLLRRGRVFGKPLVPTMKAEDILEKKEDDGVERGLHFICLVSDITRQFEFVQNVWVNNSVFGDLYNEADPIIGSRKNAEGVNNDFFTCQAMPVRRKYKSMPEFTKVVGGAYFFLPGLKELEFMINFEAAII